MQPSHPAPLAICDLQRIEFHELASVGKPGGRSVGNRVLLTCMQFDTVSLVAFGRSGRPDVYRILAMISHGSNFGTWLSAQDIGPAAMLFAGL